jgi:hypothetical protein
MESYQDDMEDKEENEDSHKIREIYDAEHFSVWGDDDYITIEFHFNMSTVTIPIDIWNDMRTDLQILGKIDVTGEGDAKLPPENLN